MKYDEVKTLCTNTSSFQQEEHKAAYICCYTLIIPY